MKAASLGFSSALRMLCGVSVCTCLYACCRPRHLLDNNFHYCLFSLFCTDYTVQHTRYGFFLDCSGFVFVSIISLSGFIFHSYLLFYLPTAYRLSNSKRSYQNFHYRVFILCVYTLVQLSPFISSSFFDYVWIVVAFFFTVHKS